MRQCPRCSIVTDDVATFCPHDGTLLDELPAPTTPAEALIGQDVGHYRVTALIGSGGMGAVYLSVHPTIGSRVAIKVLHPEMARDREAVRRFFAEARAVNLIHHENIINILDLAELPDGRSYIVMEYLEGEPLAAHLRQRGPLETAEALGIMFPVLAALDAAHEHGVVHRDLKPDNIFLTRGGHVKVLDFGIAKLEPLTGESALTQTGAIIGTPMYMSPEQATGRTSEVDRRTDIYAAGVLLYEMLSGHTPFRATTLLELISKLVVEEPAPLRTHRPDVTEELDAVVMHALAKERTARFDSAAQMAAALGRAVPGVAPAALVPPTRRHHERDETPGTLRRRSRAAVIWMVTAAIILSTGAAVSWHLRPGRGAEDTAQLLRASLDRSFGAAREPLAPESCRTRDRAALSAVHGAARMLDGGAPRGARSQDLEAQRRLEAVPAAAHEPEYWYLLGRARLFAGAPPATVSDAATRALAGCAGFAAAHNLAGTAAFVAGRTAEALDHYHQAAALDDNYVTPRVNEGLVLLRLGRVPDAVTGLDHVLARTPDHADARLARGQAHLMAGAVDQAIADLEASVRSVPDQATAHLVLGEAYALRKQPADAQAAFCRAKALGNARGAELCHDRGPAPSRAK
jgi:tRNA A-37 threonylcarbamoyl transferase component Bud32